MPVRNGIGWRSLVAALVIAVSGTAVAADWQLEVDEGNIKLYTRQGDNSPMKSYRVTTDIKASLSTLVAFLDDEKHFPDWMDKVTEVEKIREINEKEKLVYQVIDAPWPAKDQDSVLYSKWSQDPETLTVTKTIMAEPMYMNTKDNRQRQKFYSAEWRLTPREKGVVQVVYTAEIDPGMGEVKAWMEEMLAYQMPFNTLRNLRKASLDKYQNQTVAFIKEPRRSEIAMAAE
ncbi:MAG: SRPBCC family protein [Ketobacteraceae bacterium]|nr:SRPBCC family protein [Ketobacteraceae bacterium]